jgi:iron complex transport system ATP-binding protein
MAMTFQVSHGYYGYPKQETLLEDIELTINKGEVLAVLGANGIGKTTLLKCMMGLLPWSQGMSLINGKNIKEISVGELWKNIGYVPQAKGGSLPYTAKEMILLGRSAHLNLLEQPKKEDIEVVEEVMKVVGIEELGNKLCSQMSGGQLQMVLITRALAGKPQMLILDEPESSLDFKNQLIILETIERLSKEHNISCLINTHYPEHALRLADNAFILCKNKEKYFGPAKTIINKESMRKAFEVEVAIEKITVTQKDYTCVFPVKVRKQRVG